MIERKRAGARRSLAAAASTTKKPRRPKDDTSVVDHPQHPDQIAITDAPTPVSTAPARPASSPDNSGRRAGSKYTALLDDDVVDAFEHVTRTARRRLGRHVDKVEVLAALLLLAADDVSLRDQVVASIGDRPPRR